MTEVVMHAVKDYLSHSNAVRIHAMSTKTTRHR